MYSFCCVVYGYILKCGLFYLKLVMEVWFFEYIYLNVGKFVLLVFIWFEFFQFMFERVFYFELDIFCLSEKSEFYLKCCMDVFGSLVVFEDFVYN